MVKNAFAARIGGRHGHPQADALAVRNGGGNPALVRLFLLDHHRGPLAEKVRATG